MPFYENESCPVCGRKFNSEDDIVTCPQCGTPHHRECYASLGHCANESRHGTDFSFTPSAQKKAADTENAANTTNTANAANTAQEQQNAQENRDYYYQPPGAQENEKTKCVSCGAEIDKDAPFCSKCGARQPSPQFREYKSPVDFSLNMNTRAKTGYEESTGTIDGKSIADAASVVKTNIQRFISKFIENKRLSWNWGALFFGPYYLFYRKMYKEGSIFLALRLIISLVAQGIYAQPYADFYRFLTSNYDSLTAADISDNLMSQFTELYSAVLPMFLIILAANAVLHIIIALFADGFYRSKVISVLNNVDKKLEEGDMFEQTVMFSENEAPLSQSDMKKLYLGKMGGTSIFSPVMAFCIYDIITSIISSL